MRLFYLTILVAVFISGLFIAFTSDVLALDPYRSRCVGIQGTFTATNWSGGAIQVGCDGDDGLAVTDPAEKCTGEIQTVRPGQTYRLTKCSCFGSDKGCLVKGKELRLEPLVNGKRNVTIVRRIADMNVFINNSCTVNRTADVCGSNGQHITGNIRISCPTTTSVVTTPPYTPAPPQSLVTPNPSFCPVPDQVANVRITCPNCGNLTPTPTDQPTN